MQDQEIFKKHFAKAIGSEMLEEKVKVVQIMLAKMCKLVIAGYSKSIDKVRTQYLAEATPDVLQFLDDSFERKTRYLIEAV